MLKTQKNGSKQLSLKLNNSEKSFASINKQIKERSVRVLFLNVCFSIKYFMVNEKECFNILSLGEEI